MWRLRVPWRLQIFADFTLSGPSVTRNLSTVSFVGADGHETREPSLKECMLLCAGVCALNSQRLTHCCCSSYEWLKCVLGLNVSWRVTSGERHLCLPASLRTGITIGWTCGAWLVAIKDYITVASIYTAERCRTDPACSPPRSLSWGFEMWEQPLARYALSVTSCW